MERRLQLIPCTTLACMHGGRDAFYLSLSYRRWAMALVVFMDSSMNKSGVCAFAATTSTTVLQSSGCIYSIEDGGGMLSGCDRRLVAYPRWALVEGVHRYHGCADKTPARKSYEWSFFWEEIFRDAFSPVLHHFRGGPFSRRTIRQSLKAPVGLQLEKPNTTLHHPKLSF